jgi:hypothetical protein
MRLILALVVAIGAGAFFAGRATVLPGVEYRPLREGGVHPARPMSADLAFARDG